MQHPPHAAAQAPFVDPVLCWDGWTYERGALEEALRLRPGVSPLTGRALASCALRPNHAVRMCLDL